ncbi:phosphate butyryltransferase [Bacillus mesophilus]|uniref:Phosphate butyryltransferase n=1 Tax=Bacillus mesophilus TaxID=1808955 RepID=A0A6M0Q5H6_9BACI|nr:phosphate butyryltransferase [Bacillus mesophilus]MBM7660913.1 phosphate butyryltransferase [Bacillus mesophilus]NEY71542.1 phosphate butyryltransferase [Bacillus mesophilus]
MKLETILEHAAEIKGKVVAVAAAEDEEVIEAIALAVERNLASFQLYGNEQEIRALLAQRDLDRHESIKVFQANTKERAAELAVKAVSSLDADVLMKGNIATSIILKAVLNKDFGLRTGNVLSHVAVFEIPDVDRFTIVTDAGININPDLQEKVQIINNAVKVAKAIGINLPKVAPLAAVEVVNPVMQATLDGAILSQMQARGQIKDCIVDGPLALDNAVSLDAAQHKGITSDVAGKADILLVPTIEVGNVLYKSLIYFAKAKVGAVIAGAKAPIVLTSRADSAESKLYSLALAVCSASSR